jgi:hypothetical protein
MRRKYRLNGGGGIRRRRRRRKLGCGVYSYWRQLNNENNGGNERISISISAK